METRTSYGLAWKGELASQSIAITPDGGRLAGGSEGHVFMVTDLGHSLWSHELEYSTSPMGGVAARPAEQYHDRLRSFGFTAPTDKA